MVILSRGVPRVVAFHVSWYFKFRGTTRGVAFHALKSRGITRGVALHAIPSRVNLW